MARVMVVGRKGVREVGVVEGLGVATVPIRGFGREAPEALMQAMQFAAVFNVAREAVPMVPRGARRERAAFLATFGLVLGVRVVEGLLDGAWPKRDDANGADALVRSVAPDGQERKVPEAE